MYVQREREMYMHTHTYMYIYRERARESERDSSIECSRPRVTNSTKRRLPLDFRCSAGRGAGCAALWGGCLLHSDARCEARKRGCGRHRVESLPRRGFAC